MGILKKSTTLSYFSLILLLALVFTLSACKKKQSPPARDETQNDLVKSVTQSQAQQKTTDDKIRLRILYVGLPDTERQKDFVSFLSGNFIEVKTADLYTFKEEQTKDSDVIILDKDGIQWGSRGGNPLRDLEVSVQYSRPTLSLGIPGAFWTDRMRLKTGYM
jgi:predicted small lipoprotein YifL